MSDHERTTAIVDAAERVADVLPEALADNAHRFTCRELDALVALIRAVGDDETADDILAAHAADDEPGDAHYEPR
jgi:hypothetical protein